MTSTSQNSNTPRHLALTGGGTAGHVWPHFALVDDNTSPLGQALKAKKVKIFYFGSKNGMERELVTKMDEPKFHYIGIHTGKLRRYFSWKNFIDPFLVIAGFLEAFFLLKKYKINALFSKGGFVSAPVVWAAWLQGIPVIIHESDATPALATKLTLPFCTMALLSFEYTLQQIPQRFKHKTQVVGLPLRHSLFTATRDTSFSYFNLPPSFQTLLIFGGSLGAEGLNQRMMAAIPSLLETMNVIHIVGKGKSLPHTPHPRYKQFEFLGSDMKYAYGVADFCVCRAGASSIFELAAARIPMLLVPLGLHQSRGDQYVNAKIFHDKAWADWIDERELTSAMVCELVFKMQKSLAQKKQQLSTAPLANSATHKIGELLLKVLKLQ